MTTEWSEPFTGPEMKATPEILREFLRYDAETGKLFWRERDQKWFPNFRMCRVWNGQHAGREAFTTNTHRGGYLTGSVFNRPLSAHRVAWAIQTGAWPSAHIDHINGDPADNRICNLRAATNDENRRNMARPRNNASGVAGVSWDKAREKWAAQIGQQRKRFLGRFDHKQDAIAARKKAEGEIGYHANHGRPGRALAEASK